MLQNRLIPLARLPFLFKGFATTLPYAAPLASSHLACSTSPGGCSGTTRSWLRHAHDQRQDPASESLDDAALSAHLAQDAQRLAKDPVTMLMSARGIPLGVVMQLARDEPGTADADVTAPAPSSQHAAGGPVGAAGTSHGAQVLEKLLGIIAAHSPATDPTAQQCSSPEPVSQHSGGVGGSSGGASSSSSGSSGGEGDDSDEGEEARFLDPGIGASLQKQQAESIAALKQELQHMDEVFEVLAEVPWLDEAEPEQAEKKDMLQRMLLSALEERGWHLRAGVESIWQGERDPEKVAGGASPRERLALASILFHVQQLEAKFGAPASATGSA